MGRYSHHTGTWDTPGRKLPSLHLLSGLMPSCGQVWAGLMIHLVTRTWCVPVLQWRSTCLHTLSMMDLTRRISRQMLLLIMLGDQVDIFFYILSLHHYNYSKIYTLDSE